MTQKYYDCTCKNINEETQWETSVLVLAPSPRYAAEAFAINLAEEVGVGETLIVKVGEFQYSVTTTCHWRAKSVPVKDEA